MNFFDSSACWSDNLMIVKPLIEGGCPLDDPTITGLTPCITYFDSLWISDDCMHYG